MQINENFLFDTGRKPEQVIDYTNCTSKNDLNAQNLSRLLARFYPSRIFQVAQLMSCKTKTLATTFFD